MDPLAEKYTNRNPYAYTFNNPINFVDPTGMEGEGWVEWESRQGNKHMTYDNEINTVEEAKKKGYSNVSSVMDSFSYSDDKGMNQMRADGNIVEQGGNVVDLNNNETYRTTDGTFLVKIKLE